MKKTILIFGLISGAISTLMMVVSMLYADKIGFDRGYVVGYTAIVLSFLLVYFGIRSYRDNVGNGQITFAKGFAVGISITLISCLCYVVSWEILYFNFMPDFMDKYGAHMVEKLKASGATEATIQTKVQDLEKLKAMYKNPLFNAAMTFIEPFPVGLVITLLSALILKKKPQTQPAPLPAST
ncbi:MAG: DUF4199 domain-containing protein [Acidobacteria bacterium]|nr:DUF4199 domain-containing protein [Acidobacteriota bacterium]